MKKITKAKIQRSIEKDNYDEILAILSSNNHMLSKSIKEIEKEWTVLSEQYQESLTMLKYTMELVSQKYPERMLLSENPENRDNLIGFNVKHTEFEKHKGNIFDKLSNVYRSVSKKILIVKYGK